MWLELNASSESNEASRVVGCFYIPTLNSDGLLGLVTSYLQHLELGFGYGVHELDRDKREWNGVRISKQIVYVSIGC